MCEIDGEWMDRNIDRQIDRESEVLSSSFNTECHGVSFI